MSAMNIAYKYQNSLYVNLTNRCTNRCTFCLRTNKDGVGGGTHLWLSHEPSGLMVRCGETRSRETNRWLARRMLAELILERE